MMMSEGLPSTHVALAIALGCGMLIGIERERRKQTGNVGAFAGLRTFSITALLGALTQQLDMPWLVVCGGVFVIALAVTAYARSSTSDRGVTTEIALFVTYVIGATAAINPMLATSTTVVVTILLAGRTRLHRFVTHTLTSVEVRDGLILAAITLVALPLLPNSAVAGFGFINPYRVGLIVVTLLLIQSVAHILLRVFGVKYGAALAGFLSGFVSSSGTFVALAARTKETPALSNVCAAGALLSQIASMLQLLVLVALLNANLLPSVSFSVALGSATLGFISVVLLRGHPANTQNGMPPKRMFNLVSTLVFAAILSSLTIVVSWISATFGANVAQIAIAAAALVDAHAAAASVLSNQSAVDVSNTALITSLLLVLSVNIASKIAISFSGSRVFNLRITATLLSVTVLIWVPLFWPPALFA
jgi:uncharacterized membrane protein (DUF4010 family)